MGKIISLSSKQSAKPVDDELTDDLMDLLNSIAHEETRRTFIMNSDSVEKEESDDKVMSIEQFRQRK